MHLPRVSRTLLTIGVAIITAGCGHQRKNILECASPDKAYVASFYIEFGGGAAGFEYEYVGVRKANGGHEVAVLKLNRGYDMVLTWLSPTRLEMAYPDTARVDHWQNTFDFEQVGSDLKEWTTTLRQIPSKQGSFVTEKTRCGS